MSKMLGSRFQLASSFCVRGLGVQQQGFRVQGLHFSRLQLFMSFRRFTWTVD